MDNLILITQLNDFIFCPASIYFHNLYGNMNNMLFQNDYQIKGTNAHKSIDNNTYSTKKSVFTSLDVYCEKYGLVGKIDTYDENNGILIERKRKIKNIYDGYVFQLYAQYFALSEMGYRVKEIKLYSMVDNKSYKIKNPEDDIEMLKKFEKTVKDIRNFNLENFEQQNKEKCLKCIYEPACDRGIKC